MAKIKLRFVDRVISRGRIYYYYRRNKMRIRLPNDPQSAAFMAEYERIDKSFEKKTPEKIIRNSVQAIINEYKKSSDFLKLSNKSKVDYSHHLKHLGEKFGDLKISSITRRVVLAYRDSLADKPATANYRISVLRKVLDFAFDRGYIAHNPSDKIKKLPTGTWEPWTDAQIKAFEATANIGFKTALYLAIYTGQREGDLLKLTWNRIQQDRVDVRQQKTGKLLNIPLHSSLKNYLAGVSKNSVTLVTRPDGRPYSQSNFQHEFKKEMVALGVKGAVFHGLRKNAVINLLEAGCTTQETASISGQSLQMVEHYARRINQRFLSTKAIEKLELHDKSAKHNLVGVPNR